MIFEIENLGNINHAKVDLSKDLIVFTGQNNTGKTYLSYAIYGLMGGVNFFQFSKKYFQDYFEKLYLEGVVEFDLFEVFNDKVEEILDDVKKRFIEFTLPNLFNNSLDTNNIKISLKIDNVRDLIKNKTINREIHYTDLVLQFNKARESSKIRIIEIKENIIIELNKRRKDALKKEYLNSIKYAEGSIINDIFINDLVINFLPAERMGISIFSKELFFNRYNLTNELIDFDEKNRNNVFKVLNQRTNKYTHVIRRAINEQEHLYNYRTHNSEFIDLAIELEGKVLGGKIKMDENNDIYLNINGKDLSIQLSSSTIKSLSSLVFFLKHQATKKHILFIDEPELNLHPDNQRIVARVLAKMVNRGIKVIVSTHSDYFIREFNNLALLGKDKIASKEIMERYGYEESEVLNPKQIATYLFKRNDELKSNVIEVPFGEDGYSIETINQVISEQNIIAQDIYNNLTQEVF